MENSLGKLKIVLFFSFLGNPEANEIKRHANHQETWEDTRLVGIDHLLTSKQ